MMVITESVMRTELDIYVFFTCMCIAENSFSFICYALLWIIYYAILTFSQGATLPYWRDIYHCVPVELQYIVLRWRYKSLRLP
jgi:hypothetical protein